MRLHCPDPYQPISAPNAVHTAPGKPKYFALAVGECLTTSDSVQVTAYTDLPAPLSKGATAVIEGRLQSRTWRAPDGSSRRVTEIVAASITA